MTWKWTQRAAVAVLGLVLAPITGQTAVISITPPLSTVGVGGTFPVNFHVTGAVNLESWQFDLKYNPLLLQAESVTEGPFLASSGATLFVPGFIDQTTGLISGTAGFFVDLPPAPSGDGELAIVHFKALGLGLSSLELRDLFLNGNSGVTGTNASVSVVPLPGTAMLMGAGCLLLITVWGIRRWRTQPGTVV